jgi:small subunit ribosomal protein S2
VLFVGTKKQARDAVQEVAEQASMPYVNNRWLGGLLTNFQTVKKQLRRMKELETGSESGGEFENYTKKEQLMLSREREKLSKYLSGIRSMTRLPGLLFVIDSKKERIAVSEANKLGIPVIAIVDTNADPDVITVPIAGNDDAIRSVELIAKAIADAIVEARRDAPAAREETEEGQVYTYSSERGTERESGDADRRRRRPRRRRAKPEALAAARVKGVPGEAEESAESAPDGATEAAAGEAGRDAE